MEEQTLPLADASSRSMRFRDSSERRASSTLSGGRRATEPAEPAPLDDLFTRTVDLGIASIIAVTPFLFGGRHPWGRIALLTLTFATCVMWMVRQARTPSAGHRSSWGVWVLLAGVLVGILQIVSFPNDVWKQLDPAAAELLPMWTGTGDGPEVGTWRQLSLAPNESKASVAFFACYSLLFWVVLQRVQSVRDVERILGVTAFVAGVMALFGLVQYLTGNGLFFWFYDHPSIDTTSYVTGSFPDRSHFAHFVALGFAPAAWALMRATSAGRRDRAFRTTDGTSSRRNAAIRFAPPAVAVAAILLAALASLSRGGWLAVGLAGIVFVTVLALRTGLKSHVLGALAAAALGAVGLAFASGNAAMEARLPTEAKSDWDEIDRRSQRREVWSANVAGFETFPIFGAGLGSHRDVYPVFWKGAGDQEFTHAENSYLQVALETGVVGLSLLVASFVLLIVWCTYSVRSSNVRLASAAAAVAGTLTASAAQAAVDFVWYIPACAAITAVFAACACRLYHQSRGDVQTVALPRFAWIAGAAGVFLIASYALPPAVAEAQAEPDRHKYLLAAAEPWTDAPRLKWLDHMRRRLESVVRRDPNDARSHLNLAGVHLALFDERQKAANNPLGLLEIREAVAASSFATQHDLDAWLGRRIGEPGEHLIAARESTKRALRRSPLLGQAYVHLAQLAFLELNGCRHSGLLLDQALRVRPRDAEVLFAVGQNAMLAGDVDRAVDVWGQAMRRSKPMRSRVLDVVVGRMPAERIIKMLPHEEAALRDLVERVRKLDRPDDLRAALEALAAATTDLAKVQLGAHAAESWTKVIQYAWELDEPEQAAAAIKAGLQAEPYNYTLHRLAVQHSMQQGDLKSASERLEWLKSRLPDDHEVQMLAARMEAQQRATVRVPSDVRRF